MSIHGCGGIDMTTCVHTPQTRTSLYTLPSLSANAQRQEGVLALASMYSR